MNPDESFAVANAASGLADMLGEDFAFVDVVEAAAAAAVAAVAVVVVLASKIVGTEAEVKVAQVVELADCRWADLAYMRTHSAEVVV